MKSNASTTPEQPPRKPTPASMRRSERPKGKPKAMRLFADEEDNYQAEKAEYKRKQGLEQCSDADFMRACYLFATHPSFNGRPWNYPGLAKDIDKL